MSNKCCQHSGFYAIVNEICSAPREPSVLLISSDTELEIVPTPLKLWAKQTKQFIGKPCKQRALPKYIDEEDSDDWAFIDNSMIDQERSSGGEVGLVNSFSHQPFLTCVLNTVLKIVQRGGASNRAKSKLWPYSDFLSNVKISCEISSEYRTVDDGDSDQIKKVKQEKLPQLDLQCVLQKKIQDNALKSVYKTLVPLLYVYFMQFVSIWFCWSYYSYVKLLPQSTKEEINKTEYLRYSPIIEDLYGIQKECSSSAACDVVWS